MFVFPYVFAKSLKWHHPPFFSFFFNNFQVNIETFMQLILINLVIFIFSISIAHIWLLKEVKI